MNRRSFLIFAILALPLAAAGRLWAEAMGKIGNLTYKEFDIANLEGAATIEKVEISQTPLTPQDQDLFNQVAQISRQQLEASMKTAPESSDSEIKVYASAEIVEQTGLHQKLEQIAAAKELSLPSEFSPEMQTLLQDLGRKSGNSLDRSYLQMIGIDGHKFLLETMTQIAERATDTTLKSLAAASLPLIKTHLAVAQDTMTSF